MISKNLILIKLFEYIWKKYLFDYATGKQNRVIIIRGWRSALIETLARQRMSVMFCMFPWE